MMPQPDAGPDDPFVTGDRAVDLFLTGLAVADGLREVRAEGGERYLAALRALAPEDLIAVVDAAVVMRINGDMTDERRRRRLRFWRWRLRWPPWR
jgi:hypothetical protein